MVTHKVYFYQVVIVSFISTVDSLVYYALSLMATDLSGDPYISLFLSGIVEVGPEYKRMVEYTVKGKSFCHVMGNKIRVSRLFQG